MIRNDVPAENILKALEKQNDERPQVEAARQDPARFAELYENNFERVYAYVTGRVRSREDAQDLPSEAFHQALAGLPRFEWRGLPFAAWRLGIPSKMLNFPDDGHFIQKPQNDQLLYKTVNEWVDQWTKK